jgi:hypothetical protein
MSTPSAGGHAERPVGAPGQPDLPDWTEQDLLSVEEALPRLQAAIAEAEAEAQSADPDARAEAKRRLVTMYEVRHGLQANRAARSGT